MAEHKKLNWLASYPKSGNTWVRLLLGACKTGVSDINQDPLRTSTDCDKYLYNSVTPYPLAEMDLYETVYLRSAVLLHIAASTKTFPAIVKTHNARMNAGGVDLIPRYLTKSAVYLVRDPRDVVISYAKHTDQTVDQAITAMNEPKCMLTDRETPIHSWLTTWSHHAKSWDCPDVTRVRYEDLVADTEKELKRILKGFNLTCPLPRVRKSIRLCNIENLKKQESKLGFIENGAADKFFGQGKGWKNVLTENQVRRIETDHGEMMEKLGYKLEYL